MSAAESPRQPILLHVEPLAPPKPAPGAPCNGCGVCCLLEPCPLGVLLSGRRHGACSAVRWDATVTAYRCAALTEPGQVAASRVPSFLAPVARWLLVRFARRWIAAGTGCDCTVLVAPAHAMAPTPASGDNRASS